MNRPRRIALILLVILAGVLLRVTYGPRKVPAGQPPLATLSAGSLATLRADFNRDRNHTRIIVLLSPT
jgi:hypothetical protein